MTSKVLYQTYCMIFSLVVESPVCLVECSRRSDESLKAEWT
jgi:hypothetical protein